MTNYSGENECANARMKAMVVAGLILCLAFSVRLVQAKDPVPLNGDPRRESLQTSVRSLSELAAGVKTAPEVLAVVAELEENQSNLDQVHAEGGLKVFAGSSIGQFREQVTDERSREYHRINLKAGLRYPLLGSRQAERKRLVEAQSYVTESLHERERVLRSSLLTLRLQYINYWAMQEKIRLTHLFLENEDQMAAILHERMRTSHLLEADRLEFMTAFSMARRNLAHFEVTRQRALGMLQLLTGSALESFSAGYPDLPLPDQDLNRLQALINESHPLILGMKEKVEDNRRLFELSESAYAKGYLSLSSNISTDLIDSEPGYGMMLEVNFDFPFKLKQAAAAQKSAARAALEKTNRQKELISQQLLLDAEQDMRRYLACEDDLSFATQRVSAAQEQVRESLLRFAFLAGDVIENVQKSRWAYYQAATDYIDAQMNRLHVQARILDYAPSIAVTPMPSGMRSDGPIDPARQDRFEAPLWAWSPALQSSPGGVDANGSYQRHADLAAYVWDSAKLLHRFQAEPDFLESLVHSGIMRLLVSFSSGQIQSLDDRAFRGQVVAFIHAARRHGLRVELLLGDPLWILEQHRSDLTALIRKLADIPFQSIHLDLEPDQLNPETYPEFDLPAELLKTLQAVKAVTHLPIGLSIHYRYLLDLPAGRCLGPALKAIGLDEVVLMIYVSNPRRVAQIAGPIIQQFPELIFSIAQSAEPVLSRQESYHTQSRDQFLSQMGDLRAALDFNNVRSILIQSWEDYTEMQP